MRATSSATPREDHPTRLRLIETVVMLLDTYRPEDITVAMILRESLVSKGSLYYHFQDANELLEIAEVERFLDGVNRAIDTFAINIGNATSKEELILSIKANTEWTQRPDRKVKRLERIRALGRTHGNPRFLATMAAAQTAATKRIAEVIEEAKRRGLVSNSVNAKVFSTFIQAYSLGRVVDDISHEPLEKTEWNDFINSIVIGYLIDPD